MATEADITVPVCDTRGEQAALLVENIIKISVSTLPLEKQTQEDKYNELPTVEGENFLKPPSTSEVHGEVNHVSPNISMVTEKPDQTVKYNTESRDQLVELDAEEETSAEEIQQNVEESNITEFVASDPDADDVRVVAQLSKDTSIDHQGKNESYTENIAFAKEILQETSLPSEETESHAPCISEGEELNIQVKTINEDTSGNITSEVSTEGEVDQYKVTSEKQKLADETSAEDNSNTAAEEVSQENSTSTETITVHETCNSNDLQSKSDLNSPFSKEEVYGVPTENTLSESHGDVEGQSKTLDAAATDLSDQKLTEKSEENSLIQVEGSQIKHDEHLDVERERHTLTEESSEGTNDNVQEARNNVKEEGEDHKGAELSEIEPSTCTSVKEDTQSEFHAESLVEEPENTEVTNLSQEKNIEGLSVEQSTIESLHGSTIDAVDQQKSFPPIVSSSSEEGSTNTLLQEVVSDQTNEKVVEDGKHNEILENPSIDEVSQVTEKPDQTVDYAPNVDTYVEEAQQNAAKSNRTEKDADRDVLPEQCNTDSSVVASEMKEGDALDDPDTDNTRVVTQLSNDTSSNHHVTNDSFTGNITLTKEILQETSLPGAETEDLNTQVETTDDKHADKKPAEDKSCDLKSEVSEEGESGQNKVTSEEAITNERSIEDNFNIAAEEVSQVNSTFTETITILETSNSGELQNKIDLNSSFSKEKETTVEKGDRSVATSEDSGVLFENTLSDSHGDVECQSKTLENAATDHSNPKRTEKSEESSSAQVDDSKIERDEQLEEESERLLLTEVTPGGTNGNIPADTDDVRDEDEDLKEDRQIENSAESLSDFSQEKRIEGPSEEQITNATLHGNTIEAEEATIDVVDHQKESLESFPPIVSSSPKEGSVNAVLQELTSDHTHENIDEVDKQKEVLEKLSICEAHSEINHISPVKDDDEDLKESELSENDQSTTCTLVKEDVLIVNLAKSVHESPENLEVSSVCQENNIKGPLEEESTIDADEATVDVADQQKKSREILPLVSRSPEEGSLNTALQEVTSGHTDEKIIDEVDEQKEVLENFSTTVSTEDAQENLLIKSDSSENKYKENSEKEIEKTSLPPSLPREASDDSKFFHEARFEDGKQMETAFRNNEISTDSRTENSVDSLHVTSEYTKAPDLGQETEESSEEQNLSTHQQVILDEKSDGIIVHAAEEKGETLENLQTDVPNEKTEENSSIQVDHQKVENEEILENEQPFLINDYTGNANTDEVIVQDEVKSENENPKVAELLDKDKNAESVLLTEEVQSEKPIESLHAVLEDVKTSDFSQHVEATGILEEQITAENSQGVLALQNIVNEDSDKEANHDTNLEEEMERPSLAEASKEDPNYEDPTFLLETKTGDEYLSKVEFPNNDKSTDCTTPKIENLQDASKDHKTSTSNDDIETTCSLEEQSLAENSQASTSNKTIDAADKELALENVATKIPHEHNEEGSTAEVDCLEREHEEHLEKDNQNSSLTKDPIEEANASESKKIDELNNGDEDSIRPELENEENTEITYVKEEVDAEKPAESLQVKPEDIKQHDPSLDTNIPIQEQIPTEISVDNTAAESVDTADTNEGSPEVKDIAKYSPGCDREDKIPIEEVGSQNPSIEASEGNPYDEQSTKIPEESLIKEESIASLQVAAQDIDTSPLGQDRETSSLCEQSAITTHEGIVDDNKEDVADNTTGSEDEPPKEKNIANTTLYEDKQEKLQVQEDCSLLKQKEYLGYDKDHTSFTEATTVSNTESSPVKEEVEKPVEEQILNAADPQETCAETQEKNVDAASIKNASLEDVAINLPTGNGEDNSPIEVDDSVKPSSEEVLAEKLNDDKPTTTHEVEFPNGNDVKDNLNEDEKTIKCPLVKEEANIESLHVAYEDIKDTSAGQEREADQLEEQTPPTDSHGTMGNHENAKTLDQTDLEGEVLEDKNYATTPYEDNKDESQLEQEELSEKDSESTSFEGAPKDDIIESIFVRGVAQIEDPIDSSQVATVDITALAPCQDTERSSTVEQILDPEDILSNNITEKISDATGEETQEAQDIAKNVPLEDNSPNEKYAEAALRKEDVPIELQQVATEDIQEPCLSEVKETVSQEEQILSANSGGLVDDDEENNTIDSTVFQKETLKDEVPKEIESIDVEVPPLELKEEEGYLKDLQETTAVNIIVAHQEKSSNFTAEKTPCAEELDVNEDIIGHIPDVSNYNQQESPIAEISEHTTTRNEHVPDGTNLESGVSEKNNDQVVGEANSLSDNIDSEIEVLNDGSTEAPTTETPTEIDPRGWTEAVVQVPEETLIYNASGDVLESKEVNDEEKINLSTSEDISGSSNSEASEEEAQTEEAQKQESELQVSKLIQDSSMEKIERDAQSCLASADDSGITDDVQKLQELPLPAPEKNIIKTTDCKESDVVDGATSNEYIDHVEQDDTTHSFSDDKHTSAKEQEETVATEVLPVSPTGTPRVDQSTTKRELTSSEEPCIQQTATGDDEEIKIEKGNNDKTEASEENISDITSAALKKRETDVVKLNNIVDTAEGTVINENTSAEAILVNKRSITDFETKIDDEAQEITETTPQSEEGQDVGRANVEENSNYTGNLTEKKSDSNEVAFEPTQSKSGYESNDWELESTTQNQSCEINSETGDDNLKADIKSDNAVAEYIFEQEETASEKEIMKDNISSEKEQLPKIKAEVEDIRDYDQGSCEEEVITDSHQENEAKLEQQENGKRIVEFIKDGNEIETVSEVYEEAPDKVPEDLEEKILTNEAIDKILHEEEQTRNIEEPTNIDTENAQELDIASAKTDTPDSNEEGVQVAIITGKESEEHNKKDEICSSDEVQVKDEENVTLSEEEAKEVDTWTRSNKDEDKEAYVHFASQTKELSECAVSGGPQDIPEDNENSTAKNEFSEEDFSRKSTELELSFASEDIALTEQTSEATTVTTEVQEEKAGTELGDGGSKATGFYNPVVEEENDKCAAMDTSTPVEPPVVSTSKKPECTVVAPLEAEDQETKLHDLPQETNFRDSEVKDDSVTLQSVRDISEDVQELSKESVDVSNNENPAEGDPEEKTETGEGQETKPVQTARVSETLEDETAEQQLGSYTEDTLHEEHKLDSIPNLFESSYATETENVPESSICQSSVEGTGTAQDDKKEGSQQNESPPILPQAQCSDIKTSEKDPVFHAATLDSADVTEPDASPLPLKDKHVVLEAEDTKNLNNENLLKLSKKLSKNITTEYSQSEHEIVKPSKVEQEVAECGYEERTDQERETKPESKETSKAALSDLFHESMRERETSQTTDHSATEKETTSHAEETHAENSDDAEHENLKADDEEESHEQGRSDLSSEAPVIVEMGDADVKVAHKKSHNILSGVGSKVKHSIAKVKKAITGKSSPSPKKVLN